PRSAAERRGRRLGRGADPPLARAPAAGPRVLTATGRRGFGTGRARSEVELEPRPEQVVRRHECGTAARAAPGEDRCGKDGVLPIKVNLHELVQVPVEADVDQLDAVGPEVGIGQAGGEDLVAEAHLAVPDVGLKGTQAKLPRTEVEARERV